MSPLVILNQVRNAYRNLTVWTCVEIPRSKYGGSE